MAISYMISKQVFTSACKYRIVELEVITMAEKIRIESETGSAQVSVVWASLKGSAGSRRAVLVTSADNEEVREILSSGMLYIHGSLLRGKTLFRVESCRRARIPGCMFISAIEAFDPLRCRENDILREIRSILELGACEDTEYPCSQAC
jgi:hypothetical protein